MVLVAWLPALPNPKAATSYVNGAQDDNRQAGTARHGTARQARIHSHTHTPKRKGLPSLSPVLNAFAACLLSSSFLLFLDLLFIFSFSFLLAGCTGLLDAFPHAHARAHACMYAYPHVCLYIGHPVYQAYSHISLVY